MPARPKPAAPAQPFPGGIAIVGMGRWGSSLAAALVQAGIGPIDRIASANELVKAKLSSQVLWLCVPDTVIEPATDVIVAKRPSLKGQIVLHSSGVHTSRLLHSARKAGASIASIHPMMTFPTREPVNLHGVPFALEASPRLAARLAKLLSRIGGKPFQLAAVGKPLYHAAAVMASPLLVSLASAARQSALLAGLSSDAATALLEPMMIATIHNFFRHGSARSFSGPFARGDANTVSLHLEALAAHPSLHTAEAVYRALGLHALEVLPVTGKPALRKALTNQPAPGGPTILMQNAVRSSGAPGSRTTTASTKTIRKPVRQI